MASPCQTASDYGVNRHYGARIVKPTIDSEHVARAVVYTAGLPLDVNVQFITVMATKTPLLAGVDKG